MLIPSIIVNLIAKRWLAIALLFTIRGPVHVVIAFANGDAYVVIIFTIAVCVVVMAPHPAQCEDGAAHIVIGASLPTRCVKMTHS